LSGDPAQEYFSDGLTEETITDLGQLSPGQMGVIARTSAMAYKHTDKTIGQIGQELGVDYILEGSVRHESGRARISAQLIRVSDQTHLWAQNYDARDLKDLIEVQNAIGRAIADQVQLNVASPYSSQGARPHPINPEAYDSYLQGRFYCNPRTPTSMRRCIELLKKATALDPAYAQAYSALAFAYDISSIFGVLSSQESSPPARAAANKAIELDPSIAEAHAALGMEKSHYEFDLPGARIEFLKAIELDPNAAVAHFLYSNCYLTPMGLRAEAIAENKKAIELDPLNLAMNNFLGETYKLAGEYDASFKQFQHTKEMNPNFPLPYEYLSSLLEVMGKYEEAIEEREKGDSLYGWTQKEASDRAVALRNAYRRAGEKGYWKEHLVQDTVSLRRPGIAFSPVVMAFDYAQGGEKDKAFEWLEKSYEAREGGELTLLAVDPVWNNLYGDPRFSDLLKRIGLPNPPPDFRQSSR
jgi:TolB-like protein